MKQRFSPPRSACIPGQCRHTPFPPHESEALGWLRPYLRQAGDGVRTPWHIASRRLLDFLLVAIGSGEGAFTVGDASFPVRAGDLVWIPPDTPHEMRGTSDRMHCVYLHFDLRYQPGRSDWDACIPGGTLNLGPARAFLHPPAPHPAIARWRGRLEAGNFPSIFTLMRLICAEHRHQKLYSSLRISGMLIELVAELLRSAEMGATTDGSRDGLIRQAAAYIHEHAGEPGVLRKLAARHSMSPSHFRRLFREIKGASPRAVRQAAMIRRSCERLIYSNANVSEIAHELGFSNVHNFSRAFSKAMGVSPRNYKKGRIR